METSWCLGEGECSAALRSAARLPASGGVCQCARDLMHVIAGKVEAVGYVAHVALPGSREPGYRAPRVRKVARGPKVGAVSSYGEIEHCEEYERKTHRPDLGSNTEVRGTEVRSTCS